MYVPKEGKRRLAAARARVGADARRRARRARSCARRQKRRSSRARERGRAARARAEGGHRLTEAECRALRERCRRALEAVQVGRVPRSDAFPGASRGKSGSCAVVGARCDARRPIRVPVIADSRPRGINGRKPEDPFHLTRATIGTAPIGEVAHADVTSIARRASRPISGLSPAFASPLNIYIVDAAEVARLHRHPDGDPRDTGGRRAARAARLCTRPRARPRADDRRATAPAT